MKIFAWIGGTVLLAVAAVSTYFAFHSPWFVGGLTALAAAAAAKAAVAVVTKPLPPDELKKRNESLRQGDDAWLRRRQGSLKDD